MVFKVTTFSFEYFTTKIGAQEYFHIGNLERISQSRLNLIAKKYNSYYFNIYKRNLLAKWHNIHHDNNEIYFLRLRKIIHKLGINLTDREEQYLLSLESEDLTKKRSFKTLQFPFSNNPLFNDKNCFFIYKNVKFYQRSGNGLKLISNVDLYFLEDSIVFYDKKSKGFVNIIWYQKIRSVEHHKYGIYIYAGLTTALLRYHELNVIYITLMRMIKKYDYKHIIFRKHKNWIQDY